MNFQLITDGKATQKITKRADIYHAAGNIIWTDFLKSQGVRLRLVCELPGFATKNIPFQQKSLPNLYCKWLKNFTLSTHSI